MVSTLDFESSDPSSNLGRTWDFELSAKCAQCSTQPSNLHRQECSTLPLYLQEALEYPTLLTGTFTGASLTSRYIPALLFLFYFILLYFLCKVVFIVTPGSIARSLTILSLVRRFGQKRLLYDFM